MLRAGRGSAFTGEITLLIEVAFGRGGTLSIRGGNGVLRNADGTVTAHLRPSGRRITFYESDGTTLRGYAEEFNGSIRLYRWVSDSGEFVFEASEAIPLPMTRRSFASPTAHDQRPAREAPAEFLSVTVINEDCQKHDVYVNDLNVITLLASSSQVLTLLAGEDYTMWACVSGNRWNCLSSSPGTAISGETTYRIPHNRFWPCPDEK